MSFRVIATIPTDNYQADRDHLIARAAGRRSDYVTRANGQLIHEWAVPRFDDAVAMRKRLAVVDGVRAMLQEAASGR